jgi:hypothetical protein
MESAEGKKTKLHNDGGGYCSDRVRGLLMLGPANC